MLENWDNSLEQLKAGCNERTCCDYLNYWLHEKMEKSRYNQKTIQYIYAAWDVINRNRKKGYNYCWYKNFKLASSEFNNKKQLYEFLEHYDSIKNKLNNVDSSNNIEYCTFIKKMFDLYLEMEKSNTAQIYNDEIRYFQQKINCELSYVKTKCSDKCLHLVFQTKNDNFCQPNENNIGELSKSPKKYEDFNSEENIDIYCNFCTEILPLERDYPGINELCKKLARNLIDITKETAENNDDIKNNCEYLTHWIYDEMRKLPSSTSQSIGNIPFVHKLLDAGYRINETLKNKHCRFKYYRDYSFEELKEMKELHDFFKIYNDINNKITTIGSENSNYCKYISHIYDLYKKYIKNCCEYYYKENHYNDNCSDYFNCDKTYDPNNLLIKLNCSSKLSDEESKKVYDVATIDRLAKLMTEKSEEQSKLLSKSMSEKSKVQTESLAELVTVKPQEQSELIFKDRNVLITSENLFSALLNDPFYVASLGFFGLLGIFFTLFCFYKFTPLGSNFRKKSSGYEISKNNYNQKGRKKLLYENSESNNTNLKNRPYKLAYQSS
ncbi:hypothetical protein PVNG_05144 [Plasmodium vivax North Korean]|uniref:VIR protein n=1 Tax=Plasmodium vivax North Korean TaxID=1035514 RepID=A0A0J9U3K5_PLAVI|nr:hypothetical protein PVNG_05144 [Plasmodium vivax North Korean]